MSRRDTGDEAKSGAKMVEAAAEANDDADGEVPREGDLSEGEIKTACVSRTLNQSKSFR